MCEFLMLFLALLFLLKYGIFISSLAKIHSQNLIFFSWTNTIIIASIFFISFKKERIARDYRSHLIQLILLFSFSFDLWFSHIFFVHARIHTHTYSIHTGTLTFRNNLCWNPTSFFMLENAKAEVKKFSGKQWRKIVYAKME